MGAMLPMRKKSERAIDEDVGGVKQIILGPFAQMTDSIRVQDDLCSCSCCTCFRIYYLTKRTDTILREQG